MVDFEEIEKILNVTLTDDMKTDMLAKIQEKIIKNSEIINEIKKKEKRTIINFFKVICGFIFADLELDCINVFFDNIIEEYNLKEVIKEIEEEKK